MATFKGLVYVKHHAVGSKSEGPAYFLQTKKKDYTLRYDLDRPLYEPDYYLEFYVRSIVEIEGEASEEGLIQVKFIREIGKRGRL